MPGTVYTVASGKGGVGKTTTSVNLAVALWQEGNAVALVDADIGMANLAAVLDLEPEVTLHDVLAGRATLDDATIEAKDGDLMVLPGDRSLDSFADANPNALRAVVSDLAGRADYVIVDTGAGLSYEDVLPLGMADGIVLVTTPDPAAFGDTTKTMEIADLLGAPVRGLVVTRAVEDTDSEAIAAEIGAELLGTIPEDPAVMASTVAGDPLESHAPDSPAATAYRELAASLLAGDETWLAGHAGASSDEAGEADEAADADHAAVTDDEETGVPTDDAPTDDAPAAAPDGPAEEAAANPGEGASNVDEGGEPTPAGDGDTEDGEAEPAEAVDAGDESERVEDPDDADEPESSEPAGSGGEPTAATGAASDEDVTGDDAAPEEGSADVDEADDGHAVEADDDTTAEVDESTVEADDVDGGTSAEADGAPAEAAVETDADDADDRDDGARGGDEDADGEDGVGDDPAESEQKRGGFFGWLGRLFS